MKGIYRSEREAETTCIVEEWGSLTWLTNLELTGFLDLTLGRAIIKRGTRNPRHMHPNCDEVLYLLAGKLEQVVGPDTFIMQPGDMMIVIAGVPHYGNSIGEQDAEMILAYPSGRREIIPVP